MVTTLAGAATQTGTTDGTGSAARFDGANGVAVDEAGNVYIGDTGNDTIRKITPEGLVTTVAGLAGQTGNTDGIGSSARFNHPHGVAVDGAGNVFVADTSNDTIRKITPRGVVTLAGAGSAGQVGSTDGAGSAARFSGPYGVAADGAGNVFVADAGNGMIRKITPEGVVTPLAGYSGQYGSSDGTGPAARFSDPHGVAVDGAGSVYVADTSNATIRKITPQGVVTTLAGSARRDGSTDGTGSAALFSGPWGVAVDGAGNVYVADTLNDTIRKITPEGAVTTLAGSAGQTGSADGSGPAARFDGPTGVAVDGAGDVYVADLGNDTIRKITPEGVVTTLAGSAGQTGSTDGTGSVARFYDPFGVAVDGAGNIYVTDAGNDTVRKITSAGAVTTIVGTVGEKGILTGPLPSSLLSPGGIAFAQTTGDLFITVPDAILEASF